MSHLPIAHQNIPKQGLIGVGLRHAHFHDALNETSLIDFVEVHAENFFARGSLANELLNQVMQKYPVSLHSTSMGLGSAAGINTRYLQKLMTLTNDINPVLISDHACFTWSQWNNHNVHAGDLLPLEFSEAGLRVLAENTDRVQQQLGRPVLIENLSSYLEAGPSEMSETEFLSELVNRTQCGLLVDLNNILVNARNRHMEDPVCFARQWINDIPAQSVGEFHLAGYTPAGQGEMIIDDHSQPVSEECWSLFEYALSVCGPVPSLIEWDNNLPDWQTLVHQAENARKIMHRIALSDSVSTAEVFHQQEETTSDAA
ncbi:DUF692 domain-containing protein [Oceanospirillum sediminis]|uniref:DUF692 domain-containing protein n=1 Tax=Oceanospirillum sediminis TaxID=2760088 RepID=A0A839INL1_9GAMM|nr:DUF692 domain-containing protein [Oceanospirillum sediminis]MBB1486089.1 DUF692 domain-containing protein [Oceanospirillum sediminis]